MLDKTQKELEKVKKLLASQHIQTGGEGHEGQRQGGDGQYHRGRGGGRWTRGGRYRGNRGGRGGHRRSYWGNHGYQQPSFGFQGGYYGQPFGFQPYQQQLPYPQQHLISSSSQYPHMCSAMGAVKEDMLG